MTQLRVYLRFSVARCFSAPNDVDQLLLSSRTAPNSHQANFLISGSQLVCLLLGRCDRTMHSRFRFLKLSDRAAEIFFCSQHRKNCKSSFDSFKRLKYRSSDISLHICHGLLVMPSNTAFLFHCLIVFERFSFAFVDGTPNR